ncbi:unnamed protein product [Adineta ricciae]|uniref:NAD(P)(+)--arginine ADP-ribosyltransferase n=1 Tax=Adineta ricciae TaxID=249248 RepID=A0A814EZ55_ADIRI|nr:unnamed protein product [Adineta ricciae]CAF1225914.1 unnamed protein product [Adineta ricciae]
MATATGNNLNIMLRMSDLTSEPKLTLPPIKDYEKELLVSIDQAIQPIISIVPDIKEMVWKVKQNCRQPRDKLSTDELASIMLYTLEWTPIESSFYFILNRTLRSQNRNDLLPWFQYLRLFMAALSKVSTTSHRIVYRGVKSDISGEFQDGKTFIWWAFSSASSSIKALEQFLGTRGHRTIFNIECDSAKDISKYSFYESENEILLFPARQFQVISTANSGNKLKTVYLKEIQPHFPLIHIPPAPSTTAAAADEKIKDAVAHISSDHSSSKYTDYLQSNHSPANTAASVPNHKVVPPQPGILI